MKRFTKISITLILLAVFSPNLFAVLPEQSQNLNQSSGSNGSRVDQYDVNKPLPKGASAQRKFRDDQLLVKFSHRAERMRKRGRNTKGFKQLRKKGKLKMKRLAKHLKLKTRSGAERWHKVDLPDGLSFEDAKKLLENDPDIESVEPNYLVTIQQLSTDPRFDELWGLENIGQTGGVPGADISADEAWDITTGSSNVTVAVIDTGVDYKHPELADNMWVNKGEIPNNGIDDDGNGYVDDYHGYDFVNFDGDPYDDHGHGTHVSGTIAGTANNGIGVTGISWSSRIMALKFLGANGSGSIADAIAAINYATAMGAKISNNSWGAWSPFYPQALADAISAANEAGALFVAAAGNSNADVNFTEIYPARIALPNVISVAATDANDDRAWFSNYGSTTIHLGAPGVEILSTLPPKRPCTPTSICLTNGYGIFSGTSMAAPHVAGAAALLKSRFPDLLPAEIKQRLIDTVDIIPALASNTVSGGRLNVATALNMVAHTANFNSTFTQTSRQSTVNLNLSLTSQVDEVLNLSLDTLPSGITAFLSETQVPMAAGASTSITVTIKTDNTVNRGVYPIHVLTTGSESIVSATETELQVLVPDFDLTATPASIYVVPGNNANIELTLTSFDTSGLVDLAVNSPTAGIDAQLLSGAEILPLNNSVTTSLSIAPINGVMSGIYTIPVSATMGEISKTTSVQVDVRETDLMPTNISTINNSLDLGERFLVNYSLSNIGLSSTVGWFRVGYYLSTDSIIDTNDVLIGSRDLSILDAGESRTSASYATIPYNIDPGDYYLGIIVDDLNSEIETDEINNVLATGISVIVETDVCSSNCAFTSIQEAIDATSADGFIVVRAGTYNEAIVMGDNKTLFGIDGPEKTIIDATGLNSSVISLIDYSAHIEGFTIRGGNTDEGGGIRVANGIVIIRDNIIRDNTVTIGGSAVGGGNTYTDTYLIDNVITNNFSSGSYGTVSVGGIKEVRNNLFSNNQAPMGKGGGLVVSWDGANLSIIDRNTFIGNSAMYGGAIFFPKYTRAVISNSLIAANSATEGAGIYGDNYSNGNRILNSTIVDNQGTAFAKGKYGGRLWTMENSIVYGNTGGIGWTVPHFNSITSDDVDPMFVDYAAGNYRLAAGSPAIDTGGDFAPSTDYRGTPYDLTIDLDGKARPLDGDGFGAGNTGDGSDYDMGAFEYVDMPLLAADAPDISPSGGQFYGSVTVTLSSAVPGSNIYYTLDGSSPTQTNGYLYSTPIELTDSLVLNAIVTAVDYQDSAISSAIFSIIPVEIDLIPTNISTNVTSLNLGQAFDINYALENNGNSATTGEFRVGYYLSNDEFIDSNDILLGSLNIGRLNSGESTSGSVSVTMPNNITPDNYYIGLLVDDLDVEQEVDETNNSLTGSFISVLVSADVCPFHCVYSSIQAAIDATPKDGTVIVGPGTYYEAVVIDNNITLVAIDGPEETIIDATGLNSPVITIMKYFSHVEGFTLQGGNSNSGGGIYIWGGATIVNNIIRDNTAVDGGAIRGSGGYSNVKILNNVISNNLSTGSYGTVVVGNRELLVRDNIFIDNQVPNGRGGALIINGNNLYPKIIDRNVFKGNSAIYGGAIYVESYTPAVITNTLIVDNSGTYGAAIYGKSRSRDLRIINSTIADNEGVGIYTENYGGRNWKLENSIMNGNTGGNFFRTRYSYSTRAYNSITTDDIDPMFVDSDSADYRLTEGSPAIDTAGTFDPITDYWGNPYEDVSHDLEGNVRPQDGDGLGAGGTGDGSDYDMGAYEFVGHSE